jgi:hypothetical protein
LEKRQLQQMVLGKLDIHISVFSRRLMLFPLSLTLYKN